MAYHRRPKRGVLRLVIGGRVYEEYHGEARDIHRASFAEQLGWHGHIRVAVTRADTGDIEVSEFPNLITTAGKNLLRDVLRATVTDAAIKYMGVGTDNTAPAAGQTALVAESTRKAVTSQSAPGSGQTKTTVYLSGTDANIAIAELGWFAGSTATSTPGSGVMIARVLYSHTKTNLEAIQVDRTDTLS
jgi:hypothetical protein